MAGRDGSSPNRILAAFDLLLEELRPALARCFGDRLAAAAVFGSVARRTPGPHSDVDLLVVADRLPAGRIRRLEAFEAVEESVKARLAELKSRGIETRLSPVFRTPEELGLGGSLFLDMVEDVLVLYDRDDLLRGYLKRLADDLRRRGARRVRYKGAWYWDLGPGDRQRGEER